MTDPDLTDAQQEAVRRLLAEARHDEPMPADVAARLDDVVAGLAAARQGGGDVVGLHGARADSPSDAPSGAPADRNRARRWPAYLLSAAAVVAIGFGVSQMIPDGTDDGSDSSTAGVQANSAPEEAASGDADAPEQSLGEPPQAVESGKPTPPALPDIAGLRPADQSASGDSTGKSELRLSAQRAQRCLPDDVPASSALRAATYRGKDAVVVYLPPGDGERRVEVYVCGSSSDEPAATGSVPVGE